MTETQNTEKPEPPNRIETQNNCNCNTTYPNITQQILTQDDKINVEIIKRIMSKKKNTLPSYRNQDWKTVKVETE